MLIIIFSWVFLFITVFLIGKLFLNNKVLEFLGYNNEIDCFEYLWIGFLVILAILQIWSIFLPVNTYSLIFVLFLALISFAILLKKGVKFPKIKLHYLLIMGAAFLVISYFASLSVYWPDTQGYHLNAVKWANLYQVVPGLANLHTRLGFNSSFFLFASMVDSAIKDRSSHIALSFMVSMLLSEYVWYFIKSNNSHLKVFLSLTLPLIIVNIVRTGQISSLSYDFALLILILSICIELIKNNKISLFSAGIISLILLTIKLSGAAFSLVVFCYVVYRFLIREKKNIRTVLVLFSMGFILLVPYVIRNIILTGWPLYPIPILATSFSWTIPLDKVGGLFETIKAWAILPGESYSRMIGVPIWEWLPGWISRNSNSFELKSFAFSLVILLLFFTLKFFNIKKIKEKSGLFITLLASFIGIVYLIISAPDFRFGSVFFWIFFASTMAFVFTELFNRFPKFQKIFFVIPLLLVYYIAWPPKFDGEIMLKSVRWEQAWTFEKELIIPGDGSPPFEVYIPGETGSCGNSNLPCTPEYKNKFKEIVPGDISKGFVPLR